MSWYLSMVMAMIVFFALSFGWTMKLRNKRIRKLNRMIEEALLSGKKDECDIYPELLRLQTENSLLKWVINKSPEASDILKNTCNDE